MNELKTKINDLEKRVIKLEEKILGNKIENKRPKPQSIREFLSTKNINNDRERTLAIAYFFEVVEGNELFNVNDLKKYFSLAKFKAPTNLNDQINKNANFIMEAKDKKEGMKAWTLTDTGEKEVENNLRKENE
ncbi:hypothetical protein A3I18_00195 [Candidatus Campbellbacteria bacterium RIFCSPLOWO2_02_FULL_35_11]|uniref:Uncharacterized protein n=2 Tax=Candidatus Campbelliibacteriota TaxID=1752727 RepID=A0A1F5ENN5_9BACT|nr:MAG: hypothetical protein A3E89_01150 [Candidatus Campbellbacteria bacterium RIFCSPHIGHO2_12_FULL_35_10]OGD70058.1 MAG: hypothetical protein A3I18_00195 [Candidatus Campbellbacteria bacterium RIFCSPLOWO2_02_FULL_35_11]